MCSPSRSQSVQTNRAFAPLASLLIFSARASCCYCVVSKDVESEGKLKTDLRNSYINWSIEQTIWRRIFPIPVAFAQVYFCEMSQDTCHNDIAVAPRRAKIKIEAVVFDKYAATNVALAPTYQPQSRDVDPEKFGVLTVVTCPPPRWFATALAMLGFSATQRIV
jgi:hypothetical protein